MSQTLAAARTAASTATELVLTGDLDRPARLTVPEVLAWPQHRADIAFGCATSGGALLLSHPSGRAERAARHGRPLDPDDPPAEENLHPALEAAGWKLDSYEDTPHRFLARVVRVGGRARRSAVARTNTSMSPGTGDTGQLPGRHPRSGCRKRSR